MSQRLIYVMDPMCSWCWGFAPVIDAIVAAYPQLPLRLVAGGLRANHGAPLDEHTRSVLAEHWQAVAQDSGQPVGDPQNLPATFVYDTEPACRALVVARELDPARAWSFVRTLQQAFYLDTEEITHAAVLMRLAEAAGYSVAAFSELFDQQAMREATVADVRWVADLGMAGLPILLAERDGQLALLANGYQTPEQVLPLLARWIAAGEQCAEVSA
ncbi:DsbA family protein [Halopseudomonas sabulinigri]|uniref:DsbA family protein n=1 Tax=Halopseudomonas sabulinigri TaxID=472181 RepID=A0ABP9ZQ98_9GAMM